MSEQSEETTTEKKYYDPISMARRTVQVVHMVQDHDKMAMLAYIIEHSDEQQTVVICKSKKRADELGVYLNAHKAKVIHGNHRKSDQVEVAKAFNSAEINLLITTDMVLQQLELSNIERIVSFDTPIEKDSYFKSLAFVDEKGVLISLVSPEEEGLFLVIEVALKIEISNEEVEGFVHTEAEPITKEVNGKKKKPRHTSQRLKKASSKKV